MTGVGAQVAATAALLAVAAVAVTFVDRRLSRRRSSVETSPSASDNQGIRPANSGPMMVLLTIAAGCAAAAAVVGFVGRSDTAERNNSDDATVNRSTCLSTANADWRAGVGVLLAGYTLGEGNVDQLTTALEDSGIDEELLDGAETPQELQQRGAELLTRAIVNDARIGSKTDPLCPFVPGDPTGTPDVPDRIPPVEFDDPAEPEVSTTTAPDGGFTSCDQVHAAGLANLPISDPRWTAALPGDGDGDGLVCE